MLKHLLALIITIRVVIPMGFNKVYEDVKYYRVHDGFYVFETQDGTTMYTPMAFTIVEEK